MNDEKMLSIPYAVHEGDMARMERTNRRLWILCLAMFLALVLTNAGWIVYENQFVDELVVTQESESGHNNYIGDDGDIIN